MAGLDVFQDLGHPDAVDDAGVDLLVGDDDVVAVHDGRDGAEVDLEARAEDQGRLHVDVLGQALLELEMEVECPVEEARAGAARAVLLDGLDGGFLDLGVVGQPDVVVRADHDELLAVDVDFGPLGVLDRDEVGEHPHGLGRPGIEGIPVFLGDLGVRVKANALFEEVHGHILREDFSPSV